MSIEPLLVALGILFFAIAVYPYVVFTIHASALPAVIPEEYVAVLSHCSLIFPELQQSQAVIMPPIDELSCKPSGLRRNHPRRLVIPANVVLSFAFMVPPEAPSLTLR
jgi:hypothetical protein